MKKLKKKFLVMMLSASILTASMASSVFADENTNIDSSNIKAEETVESENINKNSLNEEKKSSLAYENIESEETTSSEEVLNNESLKSGALFKSIYGSDRYETAVKVSQEGWRGGADTVVVVNGKDTIMGIIATPLASAHNAPILLAQNNYVHSSVLNELKRLKPRNIYLIGDRSHLSKQVSDKIKSVTGASMTRIFGKYPVEVSVNVAEDIAKTKAVDTAYVVSIRNGVADALSIASKAGDTRNPVIVVDINYMSTDAMNFLRRNISTVYYIGGEDSISSKILNKIDSVVKNAGDINRIYGRDRHSTNVSVVNRFYKKSVLPGVVITKSENAGLIDTVPAGPFAARYQAPIIITARNSVPSVTMGLLNTRKTNNIYQIGGGISSSVSNTIKYKLSDIVNNELVKPQPEPQPVPNPGSNPGVVGSIKGKKIVIDAGHGGSDSGAVGMYGVREKDWTLKTALSCADYLGKAGANVIMTRTSDTYPTLQDRANLSNNRDADFFCSIHYNKGGNPIDPVNQEFSATGVEVYKGDGGLAGKAAKNVLNSILSGFDLKNRGVKDGTHLYVIRNTIAPAILVEGGFVSNRKDVSLLNNDSGLRKMGIQIAKGIIATFSN